jgi:hypothetical protein
MDLMPTLTFNMHTEFSDDTLPPEGNFDSQKAVFDHINSWAKPQGYAFTTDKSLKTSNNQVKVFFTCDKNKAPPSILINQKHRITSQCTSCLFSIVANVRVFYESRRTIVN